MKLPPSFERVIEYGYSRKYLSYEQRHRVVGGVKQKRCGKCRKWKAESEFYKKSAYKDGLTVWCKSCSDKAREQRLVVREKASFRQIVNS
jgi:hypothetical protein